MPYKPKKPCSYKLCKELVEPGQTYCKKHKRQKDKVYNRDRKEANRFYKSTTWQQLRKLKLNQDPLCEECLKQGKTTIADLVHHDEEISKGGDKLPVLDDLTSMCLPCHNRWHGGF